MNAGGYTLDLYCDRDHNEEPSTCERRRLFKEDISGWRGPYPIFPDQFFDFETGAGARRKARLAGWKVGTLKRPGDICPECRQAAKK